jgi:uncharacterized protein (TIGR03435 family)
VKMHAKDARRGNSSIATISALAAAVFLVLMTAMPATQVQARQSPSAQKDRPAFEIISIKPLVPGDRNVRFGFQAGGRFVSTEPLQYVISFAYKLPFNPFSGRLAAIPEWIRSQEGAYYIEATGVFPDGLSDQARLDRERLMVQSLLAERFKLAIHHEIKEMPVYRVAAAKGGPKLQKADIEEKDCPNPSATPPPDAQTLCHISLGGIGRGIHARAISISDLANYVENWTDRPLVDKTRITGLYHIETSPWLPPFVSPPPAPGARGEDGTLIADLPTIFEVFERLGLKLEPEKDKVDVYVIDHIGKPSEN